MSILSNDQKLFVTKFNEYLRQSTELYFYLMGYAGTGKTFILSKVIVDLINTNYVDTVHVCAPSHQALNNLKSKIHEKFDNNETNINVQTGTKLSDKLKISTVQKILGYKPTITNDGIKTFKSNNKSLVLGKKNNKIVIIDECSMLNQEMCEQIKHWSTKYKLKFVFVGDRMQLPPLNEVESKIFDFVNTTTYNYYVQLETILRTKSENLMKFCKLIRDWNKSVDINTFLLSIIRDKPISRSDVKFFNRKHPNFTESKWFNLFKKKFTKGSHPIIITWRNKTVDNYNLAIRKKISTGLDKSKTSSNNLDMCVEKNLTWCVDDHIIFNDYYLSPDDTSFYTSNIVKIIECDIIEKDLNRWSKLLIPNPKSDEISFNTIVGKLAKRDQVFRVCKMLVVRTVCDANGEFVADLPHEIYTIDRTNEKYIELDKFIISIINYYRNTYKNEVLCSKLWNHYYENIVDIFAKINYSYAITNHKAQGSTFTDVFVDARDIILNTNNSEMHKALYTAVTRPSDSVYLLL